MSKPNINENVLLAEQAYAGEDTPIVKRYTFTAVQTERFKAHANGTVRGSKVGTQQIAEVFLGDTIEESQVMEVVLTLLDNLAHAWDLAERAVSIAERNANNFELLQAKMQLEEIKGKWMGSIAAVERLLRINQEANHAIYHLMIVLKKLLN